MAAPKEEETPLEENNSESVRQRRDSEGQRRESEGQVRESEGQGREAGQGTESEGQRRESEGQGRESERQRRKLGQGTESEGQRRESEGQGTQSERQRRESEGHGIESEGQEGESEGHGTESEGQRRESGHGTESEGQGGESEVQRRKSEGQGTESEGQGENQRYKGQNQTDRGENQKDKGQNQREKGAAGNDDIDGAPNKNKSPTALFEGNMNTIRNILESTRPTNWYFFKNPHTVGIFSRSSNSDYEWLIKQLKLEPFCSIVSTTDPHYISNNGMQKFMDAVSQCTFGILYHTKNRGRINIVGVTDSLYDEELNYMSQHLGKEKVIVVVDDLEDASNEEKRRILMSQPHIGTLANDIFLFNAKDKTKL